MWIQNKFNLVLARNKTCFSFHRILEKIASNWSTTTPINFSGPFFIDGTLSYVYDTDTDESTGTWDDWEQSSGCSRTCGGGILIGKSVTCISKS